MKKTMMLLGAIVAIGALATTAFSQSAGPKGKADSKAQGKGTAQARSGGPGFLGGGKIMDQLNLTPDQKSRIEALQAKMRDQMKQLMGNRQNNAEQKANLQKVRAIREQFEKDFMAILTPAQQAKLKALREEMMKNRGKGTPPNAGANKAGAAGKAGGAGKKGGGKSG